MIATAIDIDAPVDRVWELTVDVEQWPSLTPTMTSVQRLDEGPIGIGSRARIVQPRQRPTTWTVTALEAPVRFEWQARVGWLTMTADHRLTATPTGCRNALAVELSGFGSRVLARVLGGKLREAIETENRGFKAAAEREVDAPTS